MHVWSIDLGLSMTGNWLLIWLISGALVGLLLLPILLLIGGLLISVICVFVLPRSLGKTVGWATLSLIYRIRVHHSDRMPSRGGVLMVANHLSWLDGFIMMMMDRRLVRTLVYAGNFQGKVRQLAARRWESILVSPGPKSILRALKEARRAVENGEVIGLFPEGGITRSGMTQAFKPGLLRIIEGTDAAVVPVYFDGLWGSIFSFSERRFFLKWPKRWPFRIDIYYGEPLYNVSDIHTVRQAVQQLGAQAVSQRIERGTRLPESVIRNCKRRKFATKISDSTGAQMSGGVVLMRAMILRRLLRRHVLNPNEQCVGVLLPPSCGAVLTNLALALDRRVAVNLNYTVSSSVMRKCIELAGIRRVLTSRAVMEKLDVEVDAELVYLDDLRSSVTLMDKLSGAVSAFLCPTRLLCRSLKLGETAPDDDLTIIFTSGSTGIPKGVMLTHANIRHNVDAINQVVHLTPSDVIVGILPFFHSFGFTITLWGVMSLDIRGAYHFNPLDPRQVGKLIQKYRGTILLSTPTFLRSYLRRCSSEEFSSLDTVVTGAEKLPKELADAFEKKFGVRPVEGYGTTELSPLVSVNVPPSRSGESPGQIDRLEGSVGRTVPGVAAKIVDESGNELPTNKSGMLLISGANVMKGYIRQPDKTADVMRDGWYVTGDIAEIDDEGFIKITGRESRFSKIGGEMVPHLRVEEMLEEIIGVDDEAPEAAELKVAVTAVPDAKKGERLIVLHTSLKQTPDMLNAALREKGLPNIFIPTPDSYIEVDEIPVLGTGKLDLKSLKELAHEMTSSSP